MSTSTADERGAQTRAVQYPPSDQVAPSPTGQGAAPSPTGQGAVPVSADQGVPSASTGQGAPSASTSERLSGERIVYRAGSLDDSASADPFELFASWMRDAFARREEHGDLPEPTAVVLSTAAAEPDGAIRPHARTVLLKSFDSDGFVVYTNRDSAKGRELAANPQAALLAQWLPLQRQVRIEGPVQDVPAAEADAYFASRPRGSQIGAWASHQSQPIASRDALDQQYVQVQERFAGGGVTRPPHWGGYRIVPARIEFWQGRADRMHDRLAYVRGADGTWTRERLQP